MKVSVITPTRNRRSMLNNLILQYLAQQHTFETELIIAYDSNDMSMADITDDSGSSASFPGRTIHFLPFGPISLGEKINGAIKASTGDIIVFMDDDDLFAPDWIQRSVDALVSIPGAEVTGLDKIYFYDVQYRQLFRYFYPEHLRRWVIGGTLCFHRSYWLTHPFEPIRVGYDNAFIHDYNRATMAHPCRVFAHDYHCGFLAVIHPGNTARKNTSARRWQRVDDPPAALIPLLKKLGVD